MKNTTDDKTETKMPETTAENTVLEEENIENEASDAVSDKEKHSENDTDVKKKKKDEKKEEKKASAELAETKKKLADAEKALAEAEDKYLRMLAEYQNFRTRSQKEKSDAYADAYGDAVTQLLPLFDNLDRALAFAESDKLADGVAMIVKNIPDILSKLGVEEIEVAGKPFDPNVADAVMRTEDGDAEEGTVVTVLQKGYRRGDKIVRHAMVSVKA